MLIRVGSGGRGRAAVAVLAAVVAAIGLAGCGSSQQTNQTGGQAATRTDATQSLKGVCPDTVVVQTSWWPEAEHSAVYQLLGNGYTLDAKTKSVTGPLVAGGVDTGVKLQIRAGGPAIGFQQVSSQMYVDKSITFGQLNTDEQVALSKTQPTLGVVAAMELDPQILLWDPKQHPNWNTLSDIGQTDTTVLYFKGSTFMDYLIGSGILRQAQTDPSYDGSPARFVAKPDIAVQGYATNEPYLYEHQVAAWNKPVAYALINDAGYPNYANTLAIRTGDKSKLDGCLRKLVPMFQRAQVDFMTNPTATEELIVKIDKQYAGGFVYEKPLADFAVRQMADLGIVGNGSDKTLGNYDDARIARMIEIEKPIFAAQRKPLKDGLVPGDIVTNEYVDPSISLSKS
jgi:hypothetical protein